MHGPAPQQQCKHMLIPMLVLQLTSALLVFLKLCVQVQTSFFTPSANMVLQEGGFGSSEMHPNGLTNGEVNDPSHAFRKC